MMMSEPLVKWKFSPDSNTFGFPDFNAPLPPWPYALNNSFLKDVFYPISLNGYVAVMCAATYFLSVKYFNKVVLNRQIEQFKKTNPEEKLPKNLKQLKAAPYKVSTLAIFKPLVLLHNVFLCVYSVWTFFGMTGTLIHLTKRVLPASFEGVKSLSTVESFWQSICNPSDAENNIWTNFDNVNYKGLAYFGYLFYLSKYYEILDTVIILLKGRPSSLLQSYHHSGAILCMWSGVRYMSPPIWIFVVFNSFIHSIMYFYFSLSCLKIRLPKWFKQSLTSLQITQFILGGSLAAFHLFVKYFEHNTGKFHSCIATPETALALYVNVFYLLPLTLLFGLFYVDSYKKKKSVAKKND